MNFRHLRHFREIVTHLRHLGVWEHTKDINKKTVILVFLVFFRSIKMNYFPAVSLVPKGAWWTTGELGSGGCAYMSRGGSGGGCTRVMGWYGGTSCGYCGTMTTVRYTTETTTGTTTATTETTTGTTTATTGSYTGPAPGTHTGTDTGPAPGTHTGTDTDKHRVNHGYRHWQTPGQPRVHHCVKKFSAKCIKF